MSPIDHAVVGHRATSSPNAELRVTVLLRRRAPTTSCQHQPARQRRSSLCHRNQKRQFLSLKHRRFRTPCSNQLRVQQRRISLSELRLWKIRSTRFIPCCRNATQPICPAPGSSTRAASNTSKKKSSCFRHQRGERWTACRRFLTRPSNRRAAT